MPHKTSTDIQVDIDAIEALLKNIRQAPMKFSVGEITVDWKDNVKYLEGRLASLKIDFLEATADGHRFRESI